MKTAVYWTCTTLVALAMLSGGVAQVTHQKESVDGFAHLGYPLYFVTLLGIWKFLGGVAILSPKFPRLKEWAYAGIFFDTTSAFVSSAAIHDYGAYAFHLIAPLIFTALTMVSWALRPPSRRLAG